MKKTIRKIIKVILCALLVLGIFFITVSLIERRKNINELKEYEKEKENSYTQIDGKNYELKDDVKVILCVGLDSYENEISDGYTNDNLADFITLLVVDDKTKSTTPIQINRDTMCDINILGIGGKLAGKTYEQLSFAHSYGDGDLNSLVNVKNAVSSLLHNIRIDNYLSITMNSVPIINDDVGGVTVYVEDDFSSINPNLKLNEYVTLHGEEALTFVRTRSSLEDSSNLARMKRQRVYLRSLYEQCKDKKGDDKFVYNILSDINNNLISNTDIYGLSDLGNMLIDYKLNEAIVIDGEAKKGDKFMEFYPSNSSINDICKTYFFNEVKD